MKILWTKAIWWILVAFTLYAIAIFFQSGCSRPMVYANGDRIQHDTDSVVEPGMVPEEKER